MLNKVKILSIIFFCFANSSYPQISDESKSIFKLASTPFISEAKFNLNFSYGINYGSPSLLIHQWIIPNKKKSIIFNNVAGRISFGNRLEFFVSYIKGSSLAFNSSYLGNNHNYEDVDFGIKWKILKSEGLYPDIAVEFNSFHPFSFSIGSSEEKFKYYVCIDLGFFYIIYPYNFSAGISYELIDNINLFAEGSYKSSWGEGYPNQSARSGINVSLFKIVNFDVGIFYMGYKFSDAIISRNGFTYQNPEYIITTPEKNNFLLLTSSLNISIDLIK